MNKQFHRVVFNAARGQRMAVHEAASSNSGRGRLKATAVVAFVALASPGQFALAQIAGDPSAPAHQRPVIVDAANGTPLAHIQTPSAGGVSRNTYRQFDVDGRGAILNNSRTQAQTQLGGWVPANPYLANGPARIILNEVNSANPSQLRGYVEVAGQRAEVIIANPAGIQVNGGGFINASRATLTTGTPQFNNAGSLESFLVRGGTVSIEGAGLDASKTDYAAILARAVQVNAGIWASELKVAAGANDISADAAHHDPSSVRPIAANAGSGAAPAFALDVAQLGGMYAGKITLIGTEAGVGVRNAGDLGAGAGGLVLTANGRLENAGTLRAARVDLKSTASIENQAGGTIEAQSVQLASAADVINRGTIRQTGGTTLTVQAPSLSNTQGGYIGAQPLPQAAGGAQGGQAAPSDPAGSAGTGGGQPGGPAQSEGTGAPTASAAAGTAGTAPAPMAEPPQPGQIVAAGSVRNDGGRIYAGDIKLQTPSIDNSGGQVSVNELSVSGPRFSNAGGTLNVANAFSAQVDRFDNAGGQLNAGQLAVKTGQLDNRGGTLRSNSNNSNVATLEARGDVLNAQGTLASTGALTVTAGGQLENTGGQVQATQALQVNAGSLVNTGILRGEQATGVAVRDTLLNQGRITSGGDTRLSAAALQSTSTGILGAGITPDGSLAPQGNLDVQTAQALQAHGRQLAAGTVNLRGASVDLSGSATSGAQVGITADTGDIVTTSAKVVTPGQLSLQADSQATQALVNTGGTLNAAALELRLANVRNTQGGEIAQTASQPLNLQVAGEVDNTSGRIVGNRDVTLGAAQLRNNAGGQMGAGGSLHVQVRDAADNAGGTLQANQDVDVRAASLDNSGGTIGAVAGGVNLATQGQTRNVGGKVRAGAAAVLANAGLDNTGGQVVGASLAIDTRGGALVNTNGALASTGSGTGQGVDIRSGALNNDAGAIQSAGDLRIDTQGQALSNRNTNNVPTLRDKGIASGGAMIITSGDLDNSAGFIAAEGDVSARTGNVSNTDGGLIASNTNLGLDTQGAGYDNRGGRTQAQGDLRIEARRIDNSGASLIRSGGTATLASAQLVNRDTQGQDQGIEATGLNIDTSELDNTRGAIRAAQDARITSAGRVDNSAGLISAKRNLEVLDPSASVPGAKTLAIVNTGGTLVADQDLRIEAAKLSSDGTTTAERDLGIALTQDVVSDVDVSAGRHLSYATTGQFTNNAKLRAGGTLTVRGEQGIDNNASREMSGTDTVVQTAGTLNNRGLIDSAGHTQVDAGTLNNLGGQIYGDRISVAAGTLNNARDGESSKAGSIGSRTDDIDLGVGQLNNSDGALISSGLGLYVGGSLDEDRLATGRAERIVNIGADIESAGDMKLAAQTLENLNKGFSTKEETTNEALDLTQIGPIDGSQRWSPDELGKCFECVSHRKDPGTESQTRAEWVWPSERYPFEAGYARHPYALPSSGATYAADDPVWKLFEVTPGDTGALQDALWAYNEDFMNRATRDWRTYQVTNRQTTQTVVDNPGVAGRITSGGSMRLDIGSGRNVNSQVIAGGALTGNVDQLANEGDEGTKTVVDSGTWNQYAVQYDPYGKLKYKGSDTFSQPKTTSINLGTAVKESRPTSVPGKSIDPAQRGQASANAQGTGAVDSTGRPGTIYEVAAAPNGAGSAGVDSGTGSATPAVIRTSAPSSTLPRASLFAVRATGTYLVETDPRFANYRQWLSSDYLLNNLGLDPQHTQKRLGDGFYEQKLIREQVAQLTGSRYLEGYSSDEEMYRALMTSGAAFAKQFQLTPGIGLTAAQMAQLTSDIVWLVEQEVTLPDGSIQKVLLPQLYVRVKEGDIQGNGALIAGRSVDLKITGSLTNKGGATIAGREALKIDAGSIDVLNGARISGKDVDLKAKEDLNVIGASIDAGNSLMVHAGRDLNVKSTTRSDSSSGASTTYSNTHIDRVAGLYVGSEGKGALIASAGNDVNLIGAVIANQGSGSTSVKADHNVNLGTLTTSESASYQGKPGNGGSFSRSEEVGSQVSGNGVNLIAKNDINIRQGAVDAGDTLLYMRAEGDINIEAGRRIADTQSQTTDTTKGVLSKKTTSTGTKTHEDLAQGSTLKGGLVGISAGGDITGEGATIHGTDGVLVHAQGRLDLHEARDLRESTSTTQTSKTSLLALQSLLTGVPVPEKGSVRDTQSTWSDTAVKGSVSSNNGNVLLRGDAGARLQGMDLAAGKDLTVQGATVVVTGAIDRRGSTTEHYTKNSNLHGIVTDAAGGFGAKRTDTYERADSTLVRSNLSGANVNLIAKDAEGTLGNVVLAGSTVNTPGTLTLEGDKIALATQSTSSGWSDTSSGRDLVYQKAKGQGGSDEQLHYNQLNVGKLAVNANTISADLGAKDSVQALAQQPGMGWVNQLLTDPSLKDKVQWQQVEEAHERWQYKQQGLTPEGAAIVTLVTAWLTWGTASGLGASAGSAVGGGTTGLVVQGAVTAGVSALASQTSVALINNQGNIAKTLDELGSSQNVKSLLTAIATGGVLQGLNLNPTGLPTVNAGAQGFMQQLGQNLQAAVAKTLIQSVINNTSLEEGLKTGLLNAFLDTVAAQTAFEIGKGLDSGALNSFTQKLAHILAGCAVGAARPDGNCGAGALGAGVGELSAELYGERFDTVQFAAMAAGIAAALAGGDANAINQASEAGANAAANNYLAHVHKRLSWEAARAAGLDIVAADLISGAVVTVDFQGIGPADGTLGYTIQAQDVDHAHMHGMCAAGSTSDACGQRVAEYEQRLWDMKSIAGLAGLLHLYQDEFAPGHANLHPYDGTVDLQHIIGDLSPPAGLGDKIIQGSAQIIRNYLARCQCGPKTN